VFILSCLGTLAAVPASASAQIGCSDAGHPDPTDSNGAVIVANPAPAASVSQPLPAVAAGQPIYARINNHLQVGFNDNAIGNGIGSAPAVGALTSTVGGTIVRYSLDWRSVQPDAPPCPYHWQASDGFAHFFLAHGVRPLWVIQNAPLWANVLGCLDKLTGNCEVPPDSNHIADFVTFVKAVAQRYPLAAGIEIWNEPNLEIFWHDSSSDINDRARHYDQLLAATWSAVHGTYPNTRILGGSLSEAGNDNPTFGVSIPTWIKQMTADGVLGDMTALSFHPYPERPPDANGQDHFTRTFSQLGAPPANGGLGPSTNTRLVVTELGAPVSGAGPTTHPYDWDLHGQCTTLTNEYDRLDTADPTLPLSGNVDAVVLHTDVEGGDGYGFGLISPNGNPVTSYSYTPRPVYSEFMRTLGAGGGAAPDPSQCTATLDASLTFSANG
jgi:hypothetical protein